MRLRKGDTFSTEVSWDYNNYDLPGGDFVTNLVRTRISYSFSPRVFVQALIQYNDRADLWSVNLRFAWLQAANTGHCLRDSGSKPHHQIQPPLRYPQMKAVPALKI
jgi:hypothetical protein